MGDTFSVDVEHDPAGRVCVVALAGKLDPLAAGQLGPVIDRLYGDGYRDFVFDLARLAYVGSLGLRELVGLANRVRADGSVALSHVSAPVREVLDLTRVNTLLRVYPSRADAIDAARSR
jgi:anti-sigma B factor antagonist